MYFSLDTTIRKDNLLIYMDSMFVYKNIPETVDYWTLSYSMTIINTSFESALYGNNSCEEFTITKPSL